MNDERLAHICRVLQGRALREEEVVHALKQHGIEAHQVAPLLGHLVAAQRITCMPAVRRAAGQEGEKGEERSFPFFHRLKNLIGMKQAEQITREGYVCSRCGADGENMHVVHCARCHGPCAYCRRCITMGRSSCCVNYYTFPSLQQSPASGRKISTMEALHAYPQLTEAQRMAASEMLSFYERDDAGEFLVWAVCGAGKTEVMFPLLHYLLAGGRRVLWATPRRDVVLELAPRLRRAFPSYPLAVLHGKTPAEEKWSPAGFALATTHQSLRFYRWFDAVIIDEVDAYPYTADEMLSFAVQRARTLPGKTIYLTATPRSDYQKRMQKPSSHKAFLPHVKIPVRYHGHLLPEPGMCRERKLNDRLNAKKPIATLLSFLDYVEKENVPAFIFAAAIRQLPILYQYILIQRANWQEKIAAVHASDPKREEKVMKLREGKLQILLTTTIMERGVTLPGIQVLVYQADAPVFDESALVQIAGRAGRSAAAPDGQVIFMAEEVTDAMKAACRQIREMNRLAHRQGYIQ
ncbi:helicase-related protein [Aneurinibacillus sp. REN35]|uniref:helicase-related protein n=1 Tax=Aneurinibacillus sp. REN35 TaxID=3237286 RepID=UPI003526C70F